MSYSVALVGAGPTTIYCLDALLRQKALPAVITIFERQRRAGQGTPYSANWSDPVMLANVASVEIPPLPERLVEWLESKSDAQLAAFGVARDEIDERGFYPRLVLGEYLADQFSALVERGRSAGIVIEVRTQSNVSDVRVTGETIELKVNAPRVGEARFTYDYVVLATGHQWPSDPEAHPGYFTSPWPASALARIESCPVGMRGTSLSAIDASVVLANQHGEFIDGEDGELRYEAAAGTDAFSITMFSRKGLLPEADFFHPVPYRPLAVCTAEAIQHLIETSDPDRLFDEAFELFRRELSLADPSYAESIGLGRLTLEEFCAAYFEERLRNDPFEWARRNLKEAIANFEREFTVPWRYAILRMHEVMALLVPHLSDADFVRFGHSIKPIFVDNYATVPHESIRRLLALHVAGKLSVAKLDDGLRLDTKTSKKGANLLLRGELKKNFPAFIEATGQRLLSAKDFPFPSLRRQGVIQDVQPEGETQVQRGIAIDDQYHPITAFESSARLFCLSLPYLLGQNPFAQGITSSAEMGEVVAGAIQDAEANRHRDASAPVHPLVETA